MSDWKNPDGSTSTGIWEDFKFKPEEPKEPTEEPVKAEEQPKKKATKKK